MSCRPIQEQLPGRAGKALEFFNRRLLRPERRVDVARILALSKVAADTASWRGSEAASSPGERLERQLVDLCAAIRRFEDRPSQSGAFHVLWFDDRPGTPLVECCPGLSELLTEEAAGKETLESLYACFPQWFPGMEMHLVSSGFATTLADLQACVSSGLHAQYTFRCARRCGAGEDRSDIRADRCNMFLIDTTLGGECSGFDLQDALESLSPATPSIVLGASHHYRDIAEAVRRGAEYYLPKDQVLATPLLFFMHLDEVGRLVSRIGDLAVRRSLADTLAYWQRRKDFLWFGDKCYHMINHSHVHTSDDWRLLNELVEVLLRNEWVGRDELDDEDIYCLSLGTWLHDIGHRGNERLGEAHRIRDNHGLIAAEFVLKHPETLGIAEVGRRGARTERPGFDRYYEKMSFGGVPAPQAIRDRPWTEAALTDLEAVALYALFHKSNAPLTREDGTRMRAAGRTIPREYFEHGDVAAGRLVSLADILARRQSPAKASRFLSLVSLLRLVDGLDIHRPRVGDPGEGALKKAVIAQDLEYLLDQLGHEVDRVVERALAADPSLSAAAMARELLREPEQQIRARTFRMDGAHRSQLNRRFGPLDNYWALIDYASFVSVQDGHFDLHSAVDSVGIVSPESPDSPLEVRYRLGKDLAWLMETTVREMSREPMSLWHKIFGDAANGILPYAFGELQVAANHLRQWLRLERGVRLSVDVPVSGSSSEGRSLVEAPAVRLAVGSQAVEVVANGPNRVLFRKTVRV